MTATTITGHGPPESGLLWAERFKLETQIGRSVGSTVWKASCLRSGEAKALRLLPETMLLAAGSERDLRTVIERHAAAKIEGVVAPEELVVTSTGIGLVLPWTDGRSLADLRLASVTGCLPPAETKALLIQLAKLLQRVHGAGLVHGALKPANVFVDGNGQVWLGDFGSAWWVGEALMRMGSQLAVMAAMPYWSLERAMGEPASVSDDLHAFGATAYEMLAGRPPLQPNPVGMQQAGKPPASIASRRREAGAHPPDLDEALDRLIMSCLAKDPAKRPASFAAVLEELGVAPAEATIRPVSPALPPPEPAPPPAPVVHPTVVGPSEETLAAPSLAVARATPEAIPEVVPPVTATAAVPVPVVESASEPTPPAPPASMAQQFAPAPPPATRRVEPPVPITGGSSVRYGEPKKRGSGVSVVLGVMIAVAAGGYFLIQRDAVPSTDAVEVVPPYTPNVVDELRHEVDAMPLEAADEKIAAFEGKLAASLPTMSASDQGNLKAVWTDRRRAIMGWRTDQSVGSVELSATPVGAEVWVSGERRGTIPLTLARLPTGRFAFELRLPGYVTQKAEVMIEGGRSIPWQGSLMRAKGTLQIQAVAGDTFEVTAAASSAVVARGVTPQELSLSEGEYRVSVERSGFRTIEQRVEVGAGTTVAVDARFAEGRLKVSAPEGSLFSLGGAVRGTAPLDLALPPGEHLLSVEYPGGGKEERRVFVQANQTLELRFRAPTEPKPELPVATPVAAAVTPPASPPAKPVVSILPAVATAEPKAPEVIDYDRVFELSEVTRRPAQTQTVTPEMPFEFRLRQKPGTKAEVVASAIVDRTGSVTSASVVRSTHSELDSATLKALRSWRFKPAEKNGQTVAVRVVVPFVYTVNP